MAWVGVDRSRSKGVRQITIAWTWLGLTRMRTSSPGTSSTLHTSSSHWFLVIVSN